MQKHSVILIKIYANVKGGSVPEGSLHKTNLIKTELKRIFFICPRDEKEPKLTFVSPSARDRVDISSGIISRGFQPLDIYLMVFVGDPFILHCSVEMFVFFPQEPANICQRFTLKSKCSLAT